MKLGFTGTQRGMTPTQCLRFEVLFAMLKPSEFHHGDCVGADAEAHFEVTAYDFCATHSHPPTNASKRAFTRNSKTYVERPYLERNHDIVDACDVLVATPGEREEQLRSGTWATVRYARKQGKVIYIIYP